tara:strand:- start:10 stop:402 length:393 start_codon:yes stop_codon:yes gene_type:complete
MKITKTQLRKIIKEEVDNVKLEAASEFLRETVPWTISQMRSQIRYWHETQGGSGAAVSAKQLRNLFGDKFTPKASEQDHEAALVKLEDAGVLVKSNGRYTLPEFVNAVKASDKMTRDLDYGHDRAYTGTG